MRLTFTKGSGKYDRLDVERGGTTSTIECPKQRIIPHDMVHFAVESTLKRRGFLTRVRDGEQAVFTMAPDAESDAVERLVEVMQGDAWSGGDSTPEAMRDLYRVTCEARACPMLPVSDADLAAIRACMAELDARWAAVPVGGRLELRLD